MEIIYGFFGLLFYLYFLIFICIGIAQPVGAIGRLIYAKRMDSQYAIGLKKYLLNVVLYFILLFTMIRFEVFHELFIVYLIFVFAVPWFFVIWYFRHIRKWKHKMENIKAYDQQVLLNAPHKDKILFDTFPKKKVAFNFPTERRNKKTKEAIIRVLPQLDLAK